MVINIRVNEEFERKLEYLQRINGYRTKSETIRKIVEKEYRKEVLTEQTIEQMTKGIVRRNGKLVKVGLVQEKEVEK